jgi:xanthine dehydrogenase accessory factor
VKATRDPAELLDAGVPFVEATVVRCVSPTSARAGDRAIILGDGTIEGFVGGACADTTVRLQALRALETGEPVLLKILPGEEDGPGEEEGTVVVANPCLSGGALELFLEPHLPPLRVAVAGESPVARALVSLCSTLGFRARLGATAERGDFACVVASLGHGDEEAVLRGLESEAEYVGLVASGRRGAGVLDELRASGVPDEQLDRVRTPAGLDIGAVTHEEIALAILAELVQLRRTRGVVPSIGGGTVEVMTATDPVCGMHVLIGADTPRAGGHVFCCDGCREAWLAHDAGA